eukprot:SAG11_NODE_162_length_13962_cov_19.035562_10_plen_102_part_00
MQLDMNLPNGDLVGGGAPLANFNVTECYARCVAYNRAGAYDAAAPKCDAWVATNSRPADNKPRCWLKSHAVHGGYSRRPQPCFVSAECRVGVPASDFPCPE